MQLTLFTDYALRSLMFLAAHPDRTSSVKEISEHYKNKKMEQLFKIMEDYGYDDIMRNDEVYEILVLSCNKTIEEIKGKLHYKWYTGSDADKKQIITSMFVPLS